MSFILEVSFFSLLIFLYCVFIFAKDDFILLRKNITLEQLFNISFVIYMLGFLCARFVYVLEHLSSKYLDPLVLFLFPYFPGLSLSGGILVGIAYLFFILNRKKLPIFRVFDIFTIAFSFAFAAGLPIVTLIDFFLIKKNALIGGIGTGVFLLFAIMLTILFLKNKIKDGSTGYFGVSIFSLLFIVLRIGLRGSKLYFHFVPEDLILAFIWFFFFAMFVYQETNLNFLSKKKK